MTSKSAILLTQISMSKKLELNGVVVIANISVSYGNISRPVVSTIKKEFLIIRQKMGDIGKVFSRNIITISDLLA